MKRDFKIWDKVLISTALTLTRNDIRFSRTGGFDNRILHLLQVLEFKAEEPRRPEGASRLTQLPQKCDLHSEHNF